MTVPTEDALDRARHEGDDAVDASLAALGSRAWELPAALRRMMRDDDPVPPAIPPALLHAAVPALPAWADAHRLRRAQRFADRHLPQITVALFCAALPISYASVPGARVLSLTGRLRDDLDYRINETARFVLDVLEPNGFDPGGRGRIVVGRVRLVHGAVRATLRDDPRWARSFDETPINQEDLLGALCLFSVVVLESLERLGTPLTARETDDYAHLWRVVGAMLGIRESLLPESIEEFQGTKRRVLQRQMRGSLEGRRLTEALMSGIQRHVPIPGFAAQLTRSLVGPDHARMLGIDVASSRGWSRVLSAGQSLMRLTPTKALTARFGRTLLAGINAAKLKRVD